MKRVVVALSICALAVVAACQHAPDPRYPALPDNCPVTVYRDAPTVLADNLGSVRVDCDVLVTEQDCLRTLQDEACRLGGNIVWGVAEHPEQIGKSTVTLKGRAAHTHGAAPTAH